MSFSVAEIIALFIVIVTSLLEISIIAEVLLSWLSHPYKKSKIRLFVEDINRPLISLVKKYMPKTGMIDFSPIIALLLLDLVPIIIQLVLDVDAHELLQQLQNR